MDFSELRDLTGGIRLLPLKKDKGFKELLYDVHHEAKNDKSIYIALLCCPDYSYKVDSNGWVTYDHKRLGFGSGMMTIAYTMAVLELIEEVLKRNGKLKLVLFYGDNESGYIEILKKVQLNKTQFDARVKCNISAGRIFYESLISQYFPNKKGITIFSVGMRDNLYKKNIIAISNKKMSNISFKEIKKIAIERGEVIRSLFGLGKGFDDNLMLEKAREQILDRIIVGTALSEERKNGNLYSIMSLTPACLISYFNYGNGDKIPILGLGEI